MKPFLCIILTILALSSCRKEESKPPSSQDTYFQNPPETIAELAQPDLAKEPTDFLRSAQNSPINWQPWTKEVFNFAERSQRLVFLFVGSNSYSNSSQVISILENKFAEKLNNDYVPVLADTEADPALAIACHLLALERNESITFPFLLWLSHEGNPVAWLPISVNEEDSLLSGFNRALLTVETIVDKSIEYVINNSRYDNERRVNLINSSKIPDLDPLRRSSLAQHLRLLNGYYDPVTGLFDRTGGLPPANLITTLTRTAQHPAISNSQRQEALSSCRNALETLSKTAIFDPLQNRFFQRRLSRSFSIPDTTTHTLTQSGLLNAFSSIDLQPAAQFAHDSLLSLARNPIPASTSINNPTVSKDCFFWTKNQLKELLSPEEFKLASFLFKLHELGNIPSSDDPTRLYFRKNSLGFRQSIADYASANNQPLTSTQTLFESLRTKLADNRAERLAASGSLQTENTLSLSNQAQLLTSLCRNYGKSPNAEILALADALAAQLRTKFRDSNGRLLHFPREAGLRQVPAFASDYATLLEALLESYRLKWDPALLVESRNLASELLDEFANEQGLLHEYPLNQSPLPFPIYSSDMIFGISAWGTAYAPLAKLASTGFTHPRLELFLDNTGKLLRRGLDNQPVIHTDFLYGSFISLNSPLVLLSPSLPETLLAQLRLQLAKPAFDSVLTLTSPTDNPNTLPTLADKQALILINGSVTRSLDDASLLPSALTEILSQN